jgi:hypothetical protein
MTARKARLVGFIGVSFGSIRRTYLSGRMTPDWTIILDPSPPTGALPAYLRGRARTTEQNLQSACEECGPTSPEQLQQSIDRYNANPVEISGRSIPVTGSDVTSAALAVSKSSSDDLAHAVLGLVGGDRAALEIAKASDAIWGRYGESDMAPGMFAYFQETCSTYTSAGTEPVYETTPGPLRTLQVIHSVCDSIRASGDGPARSDMTGHFCIVAHVRDAVTGPSASRWAALNDDAELHLLSPGVHAAVPIDQCKGVPNGQPGL